MTPQQRAQSRTHLPRPRTHSNFGREFRLAARRCLPNGATVAPTPASDPSELATLRHRLTQRHCWAYRTSAGRGRLSSRNSGIERGIHVAGGAEPIADFGDAEVRDEEAMGISHLPSNPAG